LCSPRTVRGARVALELGRFHRYHSLIDGERWQNDWCASTDLLTRFGGEDFMSDGL